MMHSNLSHHVNTKIDIKQVTKNFQSFAVHEILIKRRTM